MPSKLISNATPLIYLAKADRLGLLFSLVEETLIPEAVYEEVVLKGKQAGQTDAFLVENSVKEGRISVCRVQEIRQIPVPLHPGEVEVISLAIESGIETLLMDDAKARAAAELAGLKPRGTLWLMLRAVKENLLSFDAFLGTLEAMAQDGFYLRQDLYLRAIREARQLAKGASSA